MSPAKEPMRRIVIVGGSLAGHSAAAALRHVGYDDALTVIGSEAHRAYDRYPLSKAFMTGEVGRRDLDIEGHLPDVDWRLDTAATGLDLSAGFVVVSSGERIPFDGLVVASGARPRDVEAVRGLEGAFVLRTVDDAVDLRQALAMPGRRVVIVGGGLIGVEVAAAAVSAGHNTTLVDPAEVPTSRSLGRLVADHVLRLHKIAGVQVRSSTRALDLVARSGRVTGVAVQGGATLPADVVLMATGTVPQVEWLRGSGLRASEGLRCRPTLHALGTNRVVGAGDVVRAPHPLLGGMSVRVEHWSTTRDHAALAADNLLAGPEAARSVTRLPEFGTTIHDARIRAVGFPHVADHSRVIWGSLQAGRAVVVLARHGRPVAVVAVNAQELLPRAAAQLRLGATVDDIRIDVPLS